MSPLSLWKSATAPTVRGLDASRREAVLLNTLVTFVAVGCLALATQIYPPLTGRATGLWLVWVAWTAGLTLGGLGAISLVRRGLHRYVAGGVIIVLTLFAFALLASAGLQSSVWPLMSAYCVVFAASTLGSRDALHVLVLQVAIAIAGAALEVGGTFPLTDAYETANDDGATGGAIGAILMFGLIAQTCWHYTRETELSIDDELSGAAENSPLRQLRTKTLTAREIEVVRLVAEGLPNDGIAKRLVISPRTVHTHVANALSKTGCANRTELGVLAVREGLAPITSAANSLPETS